MQRPELGGGPVETGRLFRPGDPATGSAGTVHLESCANDRAGFLLVLDAGPAALRAIELTAEALRSPDGAQVPLTLYRVMPVPAAPAPGWSLLLGEPRFPAGREVYDALLPIGPGGLDGGFRLAAGARAVFWVEAAAPAGASGRYVGRIELRARAAGSLAAQRRAVDVALTVGDIVLPDTPVVSLVGGFDHRVLFGRVMADWPGGRRRTPPRRDGVDRRALEALTLIRRLMTLAHDSGLNLYDSALLAETVADDRGGRRLDWSAYDALVGPYLDGSAFADGVGASFWPAPLRDDFPSPQRYGGVDAPAYGRAVADLAAECAAHMRALGGAGFRAVFLPVEPGRGPGDVDPVAADRFAELAGRIRAGDAGAVVISPLASPAQPVAGHALAAEWLTPEVRAAVEGRELYLIAGRPPFSPPLCPGSSLADLRAASWLAMRFTGGRLMIPDVLGWSDAPGDRPPVNLFHPGDRWGVDGVVGSLRLKALQAGRRDMAILALLRMRGGGRRADAILRAMTGGGDPSVGGDRLRLSRCGWVRRPQAWDHACNLLKAEFINAAAETLGRDDPAASTALRLARSRFEDDARRLRVESLRARATVAPDRPDRIDVALTAELVNDRPTPAAVVMDLPPAPEGFNLPETRAVGEAPPGGSLTLELRFDCPVRPMGRTSQMGIPLRIRTGDETGGLMRATASVLVSRLDRAARPVIDGDLSDWPLSAAVAGDFSTLPVSPGLAVAATRATAAFVRHDDRTLYVGVRCEIGSPDELRYRCDNVLTFERLWPCGEDLVEIVLDPGRRAESPSRLYRLTVKPCGISVGRRGLPADAAFGPWAGGDWPSGATVAVRVADRAWYVEAAIPRAAFGPRGDENCWGLNIVRVATADNELSAWSAPADLLYEPKNLGCMILIDDMTAN